MYNKINQPLKGIMTALLFVTLFATACNNETETKTETTTDTTVTPAPAPDTMMHDTMHMDTTGVKKPIVTPNTPSN